MHLTVRLGVATAMALLLLVACGGPHALGPTPLNEGITVYVHAGFQGSSQAIAADVRDLDDVQGPCLTLPDGVITDKDYRWNDCISSVRVQPGWAATLFGDRNFEGGKLEITQDVPNLKEISGSCSGNWNDCISSVRVYRK